MVNIWAAAAFVREVVWEVFLIGLFSSFVVEGLGHVGIWSRAYPDQLRLLGTITVHSELSEGLLGPLGRTFGSAGRMDSVRLKAIQRSYGPFGWAPNKVRINPL